MENQSYRLVFTGEVQAGVSVEEVKKRLAEIYKLPQEKLTRVFRGGPVVIRSNLDEARAEKMSKVFTGAGAVMRIEANRRSESAAPAGPSPPSDAASAGSGSAGPTAPPAARTSVKDEPAKDEMACPKCGFKQPSSDTCISCGVVFAKIDVLDYSTPPEDIKERITARIDMATRSGRQPDDDDRPAVPTLTSTGPSVGGLFGTAFVVGLLNLILIGILVGPRIMWDFIVGHVRVNDSRLRNDDLWLGLRPLLWLPLCLVAFLAGAIVISLPLALIGALSQEMAEDLGILLSIPLLALVAAPLQLGLLDSLIRHTYNDDGERVFTPLFALDLHSAFAYLKEDWRQILLGGAAVLASLFFITAPIGAAITLTQLFNQLEVDEHRYKLQIPWKKAVLYSLLCWPTLGIAHLFFIRSFFEETLPTGKWVPLGGPGGRATDLASPRNPNTATVP